MSQPERIRITAIVNAITQFEQTDKSPYSPEYCVVRAHMDKLKKSLLELRAQKYENCVDAGVYIELEDI